MLLGNNAISTFLVPVKSKAEYDEIVRLMEAPLPKVSLHGSCNWRGSHWLIVTADQPIHVFEAIVDKVNFMNIHHIWNMWDLVDSKEASDFDDRHQFDLPQATPFDISDLE